MRDNLRRIRDRLAWRDVLSMAPTQPVNQRSPSGEGRNRACSVARDRFPQDVEQTAVFVYHAPLISGEYFLDDHGPQAA